MPDNFYPLYDKHVEETARRIIQVLPLGVWKANKLTTAIARVVADEIRLGMRRLRDDIIDLTP